MAGSEAKGHVVAWLTANSAQITAVVRPGGGNAGHSAVGCLDGKTWATRQIPVAAVADIDASLYIAAGSEIEVPVLLDEIARLDDAGYRVSSRLTIDRMATLVSLEHQQQESDVGLRARIGSTGKGIGAARAARIMRTATLVRDTPELRHWASPDTGLQLEDMVRSGWHVIIEGVQGHTLGLHHEYYPQCTSSDCRAIDFLAMCGISPWSLPAQPEVWVVVRPYPIRVAGASGPLPDETSWEELGLAPEQTTVTKFTRRVGRWNPDWPTAAVQANGGPPAVRVAMSMGDQVFPEIAGTTKVEKLPDEVLSWLGAREREIGAGIRWLGTGPGTSVAL